MNTKKAKKKVKATAVKHPATLSVQTDCVIFRAKKLPERKPPTGLFKKCFDLMEVNDYFLIISDEQVQRVRNAVSHYKKNYPEKQRDFFVARVVDAGPNLDKLACFRVK